MYKFDTFHSVGHQRVVLAYLYVVNIFAGEHAPNDTAADIKSKLTFYVQILPNIVQILFSVTYVATFCITAIRIPS